MQQTTLRVQDRDVIVTLDDSQRIRTAVAAHLAAKKAKLDPAVSMPGQPFIDCDGTVRMDAWILESPSADGALQPQRDRE